MNTLTLVKITAMLSVLLLVACDSDNGAVQVVEISDGVPVKEVQQVVRKSPDFSTLRMGDKIFAEKCAECHGPNGEGIGDWKQMGPDGKYPAPPLNGTAHAWHHPMAVLKHVIRTGSPRDSNGVPTGNMPAWGDKLSNQEIEAVIAWFQHKWPDEIYATWYQNNQRALLSKK